MSVSVQPENTISRSVINAANTAANFAFTNATGRRVKIKRVLLVADATVTADATNKLTFTLKTSAGVAFSTPRVTDVAGGNVVAFTAEELALLSTAGSNVELAAGGSAYLEITEAGTGPAFAGALYVSVEAIP